MKIIFVGGGTGGHVAPNLAIIKELKEISRTKGIDLQLLYIGRIWGIERDLVKSLGIRYKGIFSGKLRRYFSFYNFSDIFLIFLGLIQSFFILIFYRPKLIFAKGGFVTVPFCLIAALLRIPFVIHESDSVMGLSNRILFPFAKKMFLGFPVEAYKNLPIQKVSFLGSPVRAELLETKRNRKMFIEKYGLDIDKKTIFIFGGSQGAHKINQLIEGSLEKLIDNYNIIHQTGKYEEEYFKKKAENLKNNYIVYGYIGDELGDFLNNADIIISRAGANSIAEILAVKKPAIIIPLSSAASDHQNLNARFLQRNGVAHVLDENVIDSDMFFDEIASLLEDEEKKELMIRNMKSLFPINSSKLIAKEILNIAGK